MNNEIISDKQGIALIVLFLIGSSSIFTLGLEAKQDLWIAIILGLCFGLIITIIYIRLYYIFPGKDLFDIIELSFGNFIAKGFIIILTCFMYYWTNDVLANYGNFINVVGLTRTPKIIPMMVLGIFCGYGVKKGIKVLGRWSELFLIIPIAILLIATIFLIPEMDINNIRPVFYRGLKPVLNGAFNSFSFPFGQIVAFSMAFSNFRRKKSSYKVYISGMLIGGAYLFILSLVTIFVLGVNVLENINFTSYMAISKLSIARTLQRGEVVVAIVFVLGGFIKISILLLGTCKGIAKLFNLENYKVIVTPVTLLIIAASYFQYEGVIHYYEFQDELWAYITFPFHAIFPIIILIAAEIKKRRMK